MSLLQTLWLTSLLLSGASLCVVAGLIVHRAIEHRHRKNTERRRRQIEARFLGYLDGTFDGAQLAAAAKSDVILATEVGLSLADLVRGRDYERLIAILEAVGVGGRLRVNAAHGTRAGRVVAATRLRHFRNEASLDTLRRALDDRDAEVRLAAAQSLAEIGALPSVPELLVKLHVGTGEQSQLLRHIFRRLVHRQRGALVELLAGKPHPLAKELALDALGHSGDYTVLAPIMAASEAADIELRAAAFRALANLGHPSALPAVTRGLVDASWVVRTQAAVAAGRIGLVDLVPQLVKLMADPVWWVRFRAGEALMALGAAGEAAVVATSEGTPGPAARTAQLILTERAA